MRRRRIDPSLGGSLATVAVLGAVGLLLSLMTVVPRGSRAPLVAGEGTAADGGELASDGAAAPDAAGVAETATKAATGSASGGPAGAAAGAACAPGKNGGATDVGVTGDKVKLAATIVADGPGASFLGPVRTGMNTVVNAVNRRPGGICGRKLELTLRNDSWDGDRGQQYIKNFVEGDKVFALAVVPSSEGVRNADDYIASKGVPVVGTDGMLIHQYRNPWIWPVATSTISTMHVMAKNAYDRGARDFAIVFDAKYHFGVEGAYAYNQAVKRLTGHDIPGYDPSLKSCGGGNVGPENQRARFCGIQPSKPSYGPEARSFNNACYEAGGRCGFIAFLLEPDTAAAFMREGRDADPLVGQGAAQPLFTRDFAQNCKSFCDDMWVWTGYNPPIEALASTPGVSKYVNEVKAESPTADVANQFLEGGYLGMSLLVDALEKTGANLTRQRLKAVLDATTFDSGLSSPLTWRPGSHFANAAAQAFQIKYSTVFNGWTQKTGFLKDEWVGQDIPEGE